MEDMSPLDMALDDVIKQRNKRKPPLAPPSPRQNRNSSRRRQHHHHHRFHPYDYQFPKELFSEFGRLVRCSINYDKSGRSKGTAEVVFARQEDALAAVRKYNGMNLDEKPMKIEIVGGHVPVSLPVAAPPPLAPPRLQFAPPTPSGGFGARNLPGGGRFGATRNRGGRAELGTSSSGHGGRRLFFFL